MSNEYDQLQTLGFKVSDSIPSIDSLENSNDDVNESSESENQTEEVTQETSESQEQSETSEDGIVNETEVESSDETEVENSEDTLDEESVLKVLSNMGIEGYETLDQLKNKLNKEVETPKVDPEVEAFSKWKADTGRSMSEYFEMMTLDNVSEMDDVSALKEYYRRAYPDATPEEIDAHLDNTYKLSDDFDDDEKRAVAFTLKQHSKDARNELLKLQQSYKVAAPKSESGSLSDEDLSVMNADLEKAAGNIESISFKDIDWKYKPSVDEKKALISDIKENGIDAVYTAVSEKDGNINYEKLAEMLMLFKSRDSITKSMASHFKGMGKKEIVDKSKNKSFDRNVNPSNSDTSSREDKILKQLGGNFTF